MRDKYDVSQCLQIIRAAVPLRGGVDDVTASSLTCLKFLAAETLRHYTPATEWRPH